MQSDRLALVAGATGVAGQSLVDILVREGWNVLAVSRSITPDPRPEVTALALDLEDPQGLADALQTYRVSHLFYAVQYRGNLARSEKVADLKKLRTQLRLASSIMPWLRWIPGSRSALYKRLAMESGAGDPRGMNLLFFRTLVETLERTPHALEHIALITGGKHYGMHMGPGLYPAYQSVYREDQPRAPGPNWYYDLEDYIDGHAPSWTWSIFRPSFIVGFARNAPYNLGTTLALYATLRKARGEPLIFFGDRRSSETLWDISSARQLAQMMTWSTRSSASRNQAFNCTTGEPFRWKDLWPRLAQWFGMEALFIEDSLPVRSFFEDNVSLWNTLVQTHALQPFSLASLSSDDFVDRATTMDWDAVYSMEKAKSAGFPLDIHPEQVFIDLFEALVSDRVIPSPEALIKAEIR